VRPPVELTAAFRQQGLKVTPQRQLLFRLLHDNVSHPSADALFATAAELMPGISLRTVYQTLNDLTAMGELSTLDVGTGSTRFDPNVDPHHHLVCDGCGRITDLHAEFPGVAVPRDGEAEGFEVTTTEIVFRGRCADCGTSTSSHQPTGEHHA
jgi:Fe2+ or Zn2+ uptake regulation protein